MSTDPNLLDTTLFPSGRRGEPKVCTKCGSLRPAILVAEDGVCNDCHMETSRRQRIQNEEPNIEELWTAVRVRRDTLLDKSLWTVQEDSPLTLENRIQWRQWRRKLHRLTIDFPTPNSVVWPNRPNLIYSQDPL